MDITKLLKLLSILLANGIVRVHSYNISPLSTSKDKWPRVNVLEQDDLQQTFISIEERLRIVDSVRYGINRLEISIDRITNKLDSIETRMSRLHTQIDALESRGRFQSVMQMRLDSISQALISAEMKYDMVPEQVVRKLGASQERLLLRISSIENDMDTLFSKIQGSQTEFITKIQNEFGSKATQMINAIDEIRLKTTQMEQRLNSTSKEHLQHLTNIESKVAKNEQVEMLTSRLDGIHYHLNQTDVSLAQNDSPRINEIEKDRIVSSLKSEVQAEAQKIVSKFGNIYSEASKRLHAIENAVKDHIVETNVTQKELKDKIRQLIRNHKDCEGPRRSIGYGFIDIKTEDLKSYVRMSFSNLYDKLDGNHRKTTNLQSEILENCGTTQGMEDVEQRLGTAIEKVQDAVNNKSNKIDKQTTDLLTLLKSHSSQSVRTEKLVNNLSHDVSQDRKKMQDALSELFSQGDSTFSSLQDIRRDMEKCSKRDNSITRRTSQQSNTNSIKHEKPIGNETDETVNSIKAVEVHHPEGVIKLVTDNSSKESGETTRNPTEKPESPRANMTTILALGHPLNATDDELEELLKWTPTNSTKEEDSKDGSIKPPDKTDEEKDLPDEFVSHIMLDYIKLLRGQMTLQEFLKEANIARTYTSLTEMIKDLRGMDSVPPDFVDELREYESDKDFDFEDLKRPWNTDLSQEGENHEDDNYEDYET